MRPNFLLAGVGKAGTNSIRSHLMDHPEIYFCRFKEPNYFARAYDLGEEWYLGLFNNPGPAKAVGEASMEYFWYPESAARIHAFNPEFRLLFCLREPTGRTYSDYTATIARLGETRPFQEVVGPEHRSMRSALYYTNLKRFLEYFPREQIHVMLFDDLVKDPNAELQKVCGFLGVDDSFDFGRHLRRENRSTAPTFMWLQRQRRHFNSNMHDGRIKFYSKALIRKAIDRVNHFVTTREIPPMSDEVRDYIRSTVGHEVPMLEELLGRDLSAWKPK